MMRLWLLLPLVALAAPPEPKKDAPPPPRKNYVALRAEKSPEIDGKLDDPAWKAAEWSDEFADIEGTHKPKPRHRTRMKMCWDDDALYIAAELEEPHVWAKETAHDSIIFMDPDFEVFIDPDGDGLFYGELELNARNTTWDLLLPKRYTEGGKAINGWEIIGLKTAVQVNGTINKSDDADTGWTAEIRWPWKGLKEISTADFPPKTGVKHRINFSRVAWDFDVVEGQYVKVKGRPERNWVWSPQGLIDMHQPEFWGSVEYRDPPKK